jgi:hypothetical protein
MALGGPSGGDEMLGSSSAGFMIAVRERAAPLSGADGSETAIMGPELGRRAGISLQSQLATPTTCDNTERPGLIPGCQRALKANGLESHPVPTRTQTNTPPTQRGDQQAQSVQTPGQGRHPRRAAPGGWGYPAGRWRPTHCDPTVLTQRHTTTRKTVLPWPWPCNANDPRRPKLSGNWVRPGHHHDERGARVDSLTDDFCPPVTVDEFFIMPDLKAEESQVTKAWRRLL